MISTKDVVNMNKLFVVCILFTAAWGSVPLKSPSFRIAGGKVAQPQQFPYQARLEIIVSKNGLIGVNFCGGALISESTILTAAHCLQNAVAAVIYLGVTKSLGDENREIRVASHFLKNFKQHENYNDTTLENDIALIKLSHPIQFNDRVKTVNLPTTKEINLDNRMAVIAGFGKTSENSTGSSDLLYANRKIMPAANCDIFEIPFNPSQNLCIDGSENITVCTGDSGGPLVVEESDGSKTVVGVVSFGLLACDRGYPGAFTRVSYYLDWIKKNMF